MLLVCENVLLGGMFRRVSQSEKLEAWRDCQTSQLSLKNSCQGLRLDVSLKVQNNSWGGALNQVRYGGKIDSQIDADTSQLKCMDLPVRNWTMLPFVGVGSKSNQINSC